MKFINRTGVLMFLLIGSLIDAEAQKCKPPSVGDEQRVCSQMTVEIDGLKTSQLIGIVVDANDAAVSESIIEIYEAKENGKLVATYKTDFDGRFCIKDLPKGKYLMSIGWSRLGFNCVDLKMEIKGKTKRFVTIYLPLGI